MGSQQFFKNSKVISGPVKNKKATPRGPRGNDGLLLDQRLGRTGGHDWKSPPGPLGPGQVRLPRELQRCLHQGGPVHSRRHTSTSQASHYRVDPTGRIGRFLHCPPPDPPTLTSPWPARLGTGGLSPHTTPRHQTWRAAQSKAVIVLVIPLFNARWRRRWLAQETLAQWGICESS